MIKGEIEYKIFIYTILILKQKLVNSKTIKIIPKGERRENIMMGFTFILLKSLLL